MLIVAIPFRLTATWEKNRKQAKSILKSSAFMSFFTPGLLLDYLYFVLANCSSLEKIAGRGGSDD